MSARWLVAGITLAGVFVGLSVVFDVAALRMVLALAVCLLLPGWGWARRFRGGGLGNDRGDTLALAVVLSICATVVVATTMVMTRHWSVLGGLTALALLGAVGFVPERRVLEALHVALPLRPATAGHADPEWTDWFKQRAEHVSAEQRQAESEWVDWYVDGRRRAAEDRARARALSREADEEWAEWFRTAHPERAAKKLAQSSSSKTTSSS